MFPSFNSLLFVSRKRRWPLEFSFQIPYFPSTLFYEWLAIFANSGIETEGEGCLRVTFLWLFHWRHHKGLLSGFLSVSHWTIGTYDGYLPVLDLATWVCHWSLTVTGWACKPAEIIRQTKLFSFLFGLSNPKILLLSRTDLLSVRLLCKCPLIQYVNVVPAQCFGFGFALWSAVTV